jgi:hypothetical protein
MSFMTVGVFDGGPATTLLQKAGLIRRDDARLRYRALVLLCVTWLPLALLTALEELRFANGAFWFFLHDFGVHVRFLIAAPVLVLGESWCLARLSRSASYFRATGLIRDEDTNAFETQLVSTHRWVNSLWAEFAGVVLTYAVVFAVVFRVFHGADLPKWYWANGGATYSAAAYWHLLVSVPLLLLLLFGWLWRQAMWWKLLRFVSKLPLQLIAAHPDRSGGLKFLSTVLRGYWPLGFASGMLLAGRVANRIQSGASLYDYRFAIVGLLASLLVVILMPFTVFVPVLINLSSRGHLEYGSLAAGLGNQFEKKWINKPVPPCALDANDFSATIDLYSVVTYAHQVQIFPVRIRAIWELIVVTLMPLIPVAFASLPLDTILNTIAKFLF